jgi:oxygen-independent coproporphyrinogen III oxidase
VPPKGGEPRPTASLERATDQVPGLYVHVPFCARACPYCDFDFEVGRDPPVAAFLAGLEAERRARGLPLGLPVRTVYVGGGTPSQLGPAGLGALLRWVDACFDTRAALERTVELNPEHVDATLLDALRDAGVDRVSLGVQSLAADALVQLGRAHQAHQARAALEAAVARGLRVSADLIVGWPGQRAASLRADVAGLCDAGVEHVSIYALTIEAGTPWEALVRRGRRCLPHADAQARRLREAADLLAAAGLHHYEVASYARPGARALHNLGYWTWRDYVGLGPSAASARYERDGAVERRTNPRGLPRWRSDPLAGVQVERLDPVAAAAEGLWLALRALDGVDPAAFVRRFPAVDDAWLRARVAGQLARGNLEATAQGILRVAAGRWLWHDEIGADLLVATGAPIR